MSSLIFHASGAGLCAHLPLLDFFLLVSSLTVYCHSRTGGASSKNEIQAAAASLLDEKTGVNGEDGEVGGEWRRCCGQSGR